MAKVAIIVTSTRPNRMGTKVEAWLKPTLQVAAPGLDFTTLEVASFNLPVYDDLAIPAMVPAHGQYSTNYARAWSDEISKYDGYLLLANEYNFGMSGSTKNAIDYLYHAWIGKPILIVTYGIFGGTNASEQLRTVLNGMKLKVVETRPQLGFAGGQGPDMQGAFVGELGEDTKALWDREKKPELLKGLEDLHTLLTDVPQVHAC